MLKDDKWLSYSIQIIKSINSGSTSARIIAEDIDSPPAYTAKIITSLRSAGLIDEEYDLTKTPDQITIASLMLIKNDFNCDDPIINKIYQMMIDGLDISITKVW